MGAQARSPSLTNPHAKPESGAFSGKYLQGLTLRSTNACEDAISDSPETALRVRSEPMDLHWLLKAANLSWTTKELKSAKSKLKQVGIISYSDLEEALKEKGILNNRLRDHGLKTFGTSTLEALRKAVNSERERQRQAELLAVQRERRRLEQERRASAAQDVPQSDNSEVEPATIAEGISDLLGIEVEPPPILGDYSTDENEDDDAGEDYRSTLPPQVASPCIKATKQSRRSLTQQDKEARKRQLERELQELKAQQYMDSDDAPDWPSESELLRRIDIEAELVNHVVS